MPTAFHAVWGRGNPRIGFLGEYDALPRLSQKAVPHIEKRGESENGHGCGHNLLGVGSMAAAISLRYAMERENRKGRVEFFGCPAEETMTGKIRMVADGAFDGLDAALTWHPAYFNGVMEESLLAMKSMRYTFSGLSSHAASAPERGKSALDAVELMNVGVNYLREHVTDDVRIHYTITDGGGEPNIVPARAQSLYYVRAAKRRTVEETVARIGEIAEGAALMTGASCYSEPLQGCSQFLHNGVLEELLYDCLLDTPLQAWTPEDRDFASRLVESL
jgi:aminobenzoyl-glutamate utilization protein B